MNPLCHIQREKTILGQLKWSTMGKISVPRALRPMENKTLCQQILLERDFKKLQLLSPLKTDSALLGFMRATLNLWITYFFSTKMYSSHCNPVSSCCSEPCPFPHVSQNAASRNQATGMEHCPTWGRLLTKPDCDFRAITVSLATNVSSS